MENFNNLIKDQNRTGEAIQTIIRNFKKDPAARKTVDYYKERLRRLNEAWGQFEATDNEIRVADGMDISHAYFKHNYFTEIEAITNEFRKIFEDGWIEGDAKISSLHSSKQLPLGPTTISHGKGLVRKLKVQLAALERQLEQVDDNQPIQFIEEKLATIQELWNQASNTNLEIWQEIDDPIAEGYDEEKFISLEKKRQAAVVALKIKMPTCHFQPTPSSSLPLPKVVLPKFDGNYLKWNQFYDMFEHMINNQSMPKIQKMWYLKTNVTGEAEKINQHLSLTENNYDSAWRLLKDRYNNKRVIVNSILSKLMDQPATTSGSSSLKELHDTTRECLMSLQNMNIETSSWDPLLLHVLVKRLDRQTQLAYEQSIMKPRELQSITKFLEFLEQRFEALEALGTRDKPKQYVASVTTSNKTCVACNSSHPLFMCQEFKSKQLPKRYELLKKHNLCFNCLKEGHRVNRCTSSGCSKCHQKHNTLLHPDGSGDKEKSTASLTSAIAGQKGDYVILGTARVHASNENGTSVECRALLDSGSQVNLITERLVNQLRMKTKSTAVSLEGVGNVKRDAHRRVTFIIRSRYSGFKVFVEAYVLPHIVSDQPSQHLEIQDWKLPENIQLADPSFNKSDKIDILLGAEFYHQVIGTGKIHLATDLPLLQNTAFGWVIAGKIKRNLTSTLTCGVLTEDSLEDAIERLWKLEDINPRNKSLSAMEMECERHFAQTTSTNKQGRFVVRLPFSNSTTQLGNSLQTARSRFLALEHRLSRNPELKNMYSTFLKEYEELGHMTEVDKESITEPSYFIPHHCILKPDSTTTKLRVVFDASAKTTTGVSLNDLMHTGPTVQGELWSILLRFRMPRFAFTTDIEKMYRQIIVHPEDRKYQLIIWRDDRASPLKFFNLNTVTYGTRSAPYLATKCLQVTADINSETYPEAAAVLKNNFYVDDCLSGANSLSAALDSQRQLITILSAAGFKLRKWCANHPKLLEGIPSSDQEKNLDLDNDNGTKTLGLTWHPKSDNLCIKVNLPNHDTFTKRTITSDLARLYDPLGILSPVVVSAKIFIQELWELKIEWDEKLPDEYCARWMEFRNNLPSLTRLKFPRHVCGGEIARTIQLHVFTDASEKAYGAVAYLRSELRSSQIIVRLLSAKSRVAPLKRQTLPRLELCDRIMSNLQLKNCMVFFWNRWSLEYLNGLQCKTKWKEQSQNVKVGDMVVLKEDNTPVMKWPLGRIVKIYKGEDERVRVVDLRTSNGILKRPIHRIAPLPIEQEHISSLEEVGNNTETDKLSGCEDTPPKKRRALTSDLMLSLVLIMLLLPLSAAKSVIVSNLKPSLGIHFEDMGTVNVVTSQWNFIVYYDLAPFTLELAILTNGTVTAQNICGQLRKKAGCEETIHQIVSSLEAVQLNSLLLSTTRTKRGAINIVGNVAGALFGVLDNEYADQMSQTIQEIRDNEDQLRNYLRNQTSVIDSTINIMRADAIETKKRYSLIESQIRSAVENINQLHNDDYQLELHQAFLMITTQLILIMANLQRVQSALIDVLADTHHGRTNTLLLSANQLKSELRMIRGHLPSGLALPINDDDFVLLYKLMTIKGGINKQQANFEITLPLINQERLTLFKMTPAPTAVNNTLISINPCATAIAINKHLDQYAPIHQVTLERCTKIEWRSYMCTNIQAQYHKTSGPCTCAMHLFNNETQPVCSLHKINSSSQFTQLEETNHWIFSTLTPMRLTSVCGHESAQVLLHGTGLLKLSPDCTIKGTQIIIAGHQVLTNSIRSTFTSFGNITQLSPAQDVRKLLTNFTAMYYEDHVQNLSSLQRQIHKLGFEEFRHQQSSRNHISISLSAMAFACSVMIATIMIWLWKRYHNQQEASTPDQPTTMPPSPAPRKISRREFVVQV